MWTLLKDTNGIKLLERFGKLQLKLIELASKQKLNETKLKIKMFASARKTK